GGRPAPYLLLQVAQGERSARAVARGVEPAPLIPDGPGAAVIPAQGVLLAGLRRQLVPGHRRQQLQHLLGGLQLVLARGGPDEEAPQDRLADVHRVEQVPHLRVGQPEAHGAADRRLVAADQLGRRLLVPGADAADQLLEGRGFGHRPAPLGNRPEGSRYLTRAGPPPPGPAPHGAGRTPGRPVPSRSGPFREPGPPGPARGPLRRPEARHAPRATKLGLGSFGEPAEPGIPGCTPYRVPS